MSAEIQVRDYLRSRSEVMALLNDDPLRMNVDFKGDLRATHVTIALAGGEFHNYLPVHHPLLYLHCFGSTRPAAASLAEAVALALRDLTEAARPLAGAEVLSMNFLPTGDGVARYVVATSVVAKLGLAA